MEKRRKFTGEFKLEAVWLDHFSKNLRRQNFDLIAPHVQMPAHL